MDTARPAEGAGEPTAAGPRRRGPGSPGSRLRSLVVAVWTRLWMRWAGTGPLGRVAAGLAGLATQPYLGRIRLARLYPRGYTAPSAAVCHRGCRRGRHTFVGDRCVIYGFSAAAGQVVLADRVHLVSDVRMEVGDGGSIVVGADTWIQPNCHFASFLAPISIGANVQIASYCRFYSYDHAVAADRPIHQQGLVSRGPIVIEDDAWLGTGVVVLAGVCIGRGAVLGAAAVVTRDIPAGAIAVGSPARVVRYRTDPA
jgi:acetyltransferase-like isoleucine patch superfamily enzyme